jgi:hypothetical protein
MKDSFRRILDLVRRTGDRMVVTDPDGEDAFVVMDIDEYEALVDLETQYFGHLGGEDGEDEPAKTQAPRPPKGPDIWDAMPQAQDAESAETWDFDKLSPKEKADFEAAFEEAASKDKKPETEPKQQQKPNDDDDLGEEQFYLEPIE